MPGVMTSDARIDSSSVGSPDRFRSLAELEQALASLDSPRDGGSVRLLMRRLEGGRREHLTRTSLAPEAGIPGDAWATRGQPKPDAAIAVMQIAVAELIANQQPLELFGDNLFLDLDLSNANLPCGSVLRLGGAVVRVTPEPHNGCRKFQSRFGNDALRFVCQPVTRHLNLRGIYIRVLEAGDIAVGDTVKVISRA